MSLVAPLRAQAEATIPIASSAASPVEQLVQRLSAEVDAAEDRVHTLRTEAAKVFVRQEQQLMRFVPVANRIHAILLPRLQAFTNVEVFKDIQQTVSLELRGPKSRGFHGRTINLIVPYSDNHPTPMKFSFRVGHDGPMENAIMDYRLEILPIFVKFDGHDQLVIPIDDLNEEIISAWIDDKLVRFTKTYFEVFFHAEYQRKSMELDPVLNIRFPRALAVATQEFRSHIYHFYTKESCQLFEQDPSEYLETASSPGVEQA